MPIQLTESHQEREQIGQLVDASRSGEGIMRSNDSCGLHYFSPNTEKLSLKEYFSIN